MLVLHGLPSLLLYSIQDLLPRVTVNSELGHPTSIIHQENAPPVGAGLWEIAEFCGGPAMHSGTGGVAQLREAGGGGSGMG